MFASSASLSSRITKQLRASLVRTSRCPTAQGSSVYTYTGADAVYSDARRYVWLPAGAGGLVAGVHA